MASAMFIVKYSGQPVRFHNLQGARVIWECVRTAAYATVFTSIAEAWHAVSDYDLEPSRCEVVPAAGHDEKEGGGGRGAPAVTLARGGSPLPPP